MFPLALGTQTIGSVIRPASFNGVAGFKPTFGRTNLLGVYPVGRKLDHLGFFSNRVTDLELISPVLVSDWDSRKVNESVDLKNLTVGVPDGLWCFEGDLTLSDCTCFLELTEVKTPRKLSELTQIGPKQSNRVVFRFNIGNKLGKF